MKKSFGLSFGILFLLSWFSGSSELVAFPEMVRHGYGNCSSCHISPAGGGILTNYGRELGKEVLSTWSGENEHLPFYKPVALPEPLRIGGDIRTIQTYVDTPAVRQGKYFLMQADLELAWATESYTVAASIGRDMGSPNTGSDDKWSSRRHYLLLPLKPIGDGFSVRLGRFYKNYGLMIPDHTSEIRRGIGWDQNSETYNAEFNYQTEEYSLSVTAVGGRPDDEDVVSDKGAAFSASRLFNSKYKVGLSYFYGNSSDDVGRELFGIFWALGFTEQLYWLGEYDLTRTAPEDVELSEGFASYNRVGYEIYKGFDLYLVHQAKKSDNDSSKLDVQRFGPGLQWSPRPHWILTAQWEKVTRYTVSSKAYDSAWFVFQYAI